MWKPLPEQRHPKRISTPASWELLSLPQNPAEGVRGKSLSGLPHPEPCTQASTEREGDDGEVGEPGSGRIKGENIGTTYTHHTFIFLF